MVPHAKQRIMKMVPCKGNGPAHYKNGPGLYGNGPGLYGNGPGLYGNGPGLYGNGPTHKGIGPVQKKWLLSGRTLHGVCLENWS